ncbi:GSCOCG00008030001-RA-CDS, partial [Cotesia congregata]
DDFKNQKINIDKNKNQKIDEINYQENDLKNIDENYQSFEKNLNFDKNSNFEKIEEKIIIENENDELIEDNFTEKLNEKSKTKVCTKTCKKLSEKLQKSKEELQNFQKNFSNLKKTFLKNMLSSDYSSKKNVLLFNIRLARNEYFIIDKLQTILIYSTGTMLPLSEVEWKTPIQQMEKLCFDLDDDYSKKLELLNDEEYCKTNESISCICNVLPPLPKRDLTLLIQIAFNLYRDNLRRVDPSFNQAPGYPPGFNQTSLYGSPMIYQQRPQFWNQISSSANFNSNYQQFMPRNNPVYAGWNSKLFAGNNIINNNNNINDQNNVNGQWSLKADIKSELIDINSKKEFINYDEINSKGSLSDMKEKTHAFNYTEPPESLNNDKVHKVHEVLIDNCEEDLKKVLEDWKSIWEDKSEFKDYKEEMGGDKKEVEEEEEMECELKEEIGKKKSYSMDKLLRELRAKHRGVLEYDLLYCVDAVRNKYNGSLSGLTLAEIIGEVEKVLPGRERLQLRNYDRRIFSKKQVKKLEKVQGAKSTNSQKVVKKSTSKSNPWATLDGYQWTNEDFGENECIICTEAIIKFGKVPSYTLRCKHTFHKK